MHLLMDHISTLLPLRDTGEETKDKTAVDHGLEYDLNNYSNACHRRLIKIPPCPSLHVSISFFFFFTFSITSFSIFFIFFSSYPTWSRIRDSDV